MLCYGSAESAVSKGKYLQKSVPPFSLKNDRVWIASELPLSNGPAVESPATETATSKTVGMWGGSALVVEEQIL